MTHAIPDSLIAGPDALRCRWVRAETTRYIDPFFQSTLARMRMRRPDVELTPVETLRERGLAFQPIAPAAFIFHVSRCGSTLFAQLLAEHEQAAVLSEAPVLDQILRSGRPDRFELFDAALRLLSNGAGRGNRLFLKTDCWHVFDAAELRRLYPETPFILLYRSPQAVLASQQRGRGSHMVPGVLPGSAIGVSFDAPRMSVDDYGTQVLASLYGAVLRAARTDPHALLVSYDEGFPQVFLRAARWLGLPLDEAYLARIEARCGYHGKHPEDVFSGDPAPAAPPLDNADLAGAYRGLEEARLSASPDRSAALR